MVLKYHSIEEFRQHSIQGKIIHFKGFARRIDYSCKIVQSYEEAVLQLFLELRPDVLAWDGDEYRADSFTRLIPKIHKLLPELRLVMFRTSKFKKQEIVLSAESSFEWYCDYHKNELKDEIKVYLCDSGASYDRLGHLALEHTGSEHVVCFGGGMTLAKEFELASRNLKHVSFHLIPVHRRHNEDAKKYEFCSLLQTSSGNLRRVVEPVVADAIEA